MAVTINVLKRFSLGGGYNVIADVTFDSSYPTGGEEVHPKYLGLTELNFVLPSTSGGYIFEYDHANYKLKAFTPSRAVSNHIHNGFKILNSQTAADKTAFVEVKDGAGDNLTAAAYIAAAGGGSDFYVPTNGAGAISAASASEVADTTDLSAVKVRICAFGY